MWFRVVAALAIVALAGLVWVLVSPPKQPAPVAPGVAVQTK